MKLGIFLLGLGKSDEFESLTDLLPSDLPAQFVCEGPTGPGPGPPPGPPPPSRIVGGAFATDSWPFLIQLRSWKSQNQAESKPNNHDLCGGVIIHDRWVLTGKFSL